jgi:hypothetical protein
MEEKWMGTAYRHPDDMPEGTLASMNMTRDDYEHLVRERAERNYKAPKAGDLAPNFVIERLGPDGKRAGGLFKLSEARGRLLALAFGSFTAPPFRAGISALNEVYDEFGDRADFYCIYVREAHPGGPRGDGSVGHFPLPPQTGAPDANDDETTYDEPTSLDERARLAHLLVSRCDLRIPILLDGIDNAVDDLYAAMPLRLYLIDDQGAVIFRTPAGSPGFSPDAWRQAIEQHLDHSPTG